MTDDARSRRFGTTWGMAELDARFASALPRKRAGCLFSIRRRFHKWRNGYLIAGKGKIGAACKVLRLASSPMETAAAPAPATRAGNASAFRALRFSMGPIQFEEFSRRESALRLSGVGRLLAGSVDQDPRIIISGDSRAQLEPKKARGACDFP